MKKLLIGIAVVSLVSIASLGGVLNSKNQASTPIYEDFTFNFYNNSFGVDAFIYQAYVSPTEIQQKTISIPRSKSVKLNAAGYVSTASSKFVVDRFGTTNSTGSIYLKNTYKNQDSVLMNSQSALGKVTADALKVDTFNFQSGSFGSNATIKLLYKSQEVGYASVPDVI